MVTRVVLALAAAVIAVPAVAAERLPYDFANLVYRSQAPEPLLDQIRAPAPRIGYDISGLLYDRTPDHLGLGYRLEGLTGRTPAHRVIRDYGPLDYDIDGLLSVTYASAD